MARRPLNMEALWDRDNEADFISHAWFTWNTQRQPMRDKWKELRNYVFATDTTTTTNSTLPWKNSTTLPKLCQIRDNLHSNYISALFPNDDWLKWEAYTKDSAAKEKKEAIEAYMGNKARMGGLREEIDNLVYDYIDYGNAFVTADFESSVVSGIGGEKNTNYIGPRARRISPLDICFDPTVSDFKQAPKIIRSIKTLGELYSMVEENPQDAPYLEAALKKREKVKQSATKWSVDDLDKSEAYTVDGFGNLDDYLRSNVVELLQFYGDIYDEKENKLYRNYVITIIDRAWVIQKQPLPNWLGHAPIYQVGWRSRPDNLWAMGPLDNLVGMQYRIDHLENAKADAMDLAIHPPLVIQGEVEQFVYGPGQEIHIDENGGVVELARNVQWVIQANNEISMLVALMEQFAGAPSEAMGIRTPGEKTAFEVQQLQNAAGRIFQEKVTNFEVYLLEPLLNAMLEIAKRFMDGSDVISVIDDDLGVQRFTEVTKEDITASGKIRPIGARHFAAQAQLMQNLSQLLATPVGQVISPHISSKKLANLVEDIIGLGRYELFSPNAAVFEQQETQRLVTQSQEDLAMEQQTAPPF